MELKKKYNLTINFQLEINKEQKLAIVAIIMNIIKTNIMICIYQFRGIIIILNHRYLLFQHYHGLFMTEKIWGKCYLQNFHKK